MNKIIQLATDPQRSTGSSWVITRGAHRHSLSRTHTPPRAIIIAYYDGARWRSFHWKPISTTQRYFLYNIFLDNISCTIFSGTILVCLLHVQHFPVQHFQYNNFLYNIFLYNIFCTAFSCTIWSVQHFLYNVF